MRSTLTKLVLTCLAGTFIFHSCTRNKEEKYKVYAEHDPLIKNIDSTISPGEDFFRYANGTWIKKNPIPGAYSSWSIGNVVVEEIRNNLRKISEEAQKDPSKSRSSQKIGDFYASGMDTVGIEKAGLKELQNDFNRIKNLKTPADVINTAAYLTTIGIDNIFGPYVAQDDKNSSKMMLQFYQSGLGLPNRDYYFNTDARTSKIREDYKNKHLPKMLELSGYTAGDAGEAAKKVYAIEKFLADSSRKLEDLRDPYANYHKYTIAQFNKVTPGISWGPLLDGMGIKGIDTVIVGQPEYYTAVSAALVKFPIDDWKAYLQWKLVSDLSSFLKKDIDNEHFRFYGTVISGRTEQLPRWKRVIDAENSLMSEILGQLFVKEYFPEEAKERYTKLVKAIKDELQDHIQKLDWMSQATKEKAIYKLSKVNAKVGYPDKWKDYSSLKISKDSYVRNVINCNRWNYTNSIAKLGKPVDRTEWSMSPQTYNAYYNPSNNEIVLPAAIFTIPGVKDDQVDDAVVYGYAAASTIGHEITHGFDDQGRQYDEQGNLKAWWTNTDSAKFAGRADMLVKQFNGYKLLDSLHINGKATLGENIADLGGIVLGLDAFKKTEQYKEGRKINGLTPVQRYFMGYALGWLGHERDESLANQLLTDVHSPGFMRVNGPFQDVPEFYEAFGIKKGDKMYLAPEKRVKIW
ncbi:M13 family peptidase [Pedobacter sp. HMF7647]|uniref:M13 family peptidase n=1 Tax=Hufsiella arboris TaxID=2695275 RepID=A0A7K1YBW6_9SPHI|nr:M13 family metallopeptidase [Hufsiella arboris]MXV51579.1 M13 family peptidase [Hufsiella arboris]